MKAKLRRLAESIGNDGGRARVHVVDASDEDQIVRYLDMAVAELGPRGEGIDGVFNAIGLTAQAGGYPARTIGLP